LNNDVFLLLVLFIRFNIYSSLHIPISSNIIQCIAVDGQIGFVENHNVEPLHFISINKQSTINTMFHRKTGNYDNQ